MASPVIGNIEIFDANSDDFPSYAEQIEQYMIANDVKDEKRKAAIFLTLVGRKTYNLLRDLALPGKPADLKFTEAIELLKNHFNPKPLVIAKRYKFYQRRQETAENVAEYLAPLRKCAEHCNFADFLQQALRDKFVCGLNSSTIQQRLLAESELTLKRALEIAQSMEAAAKTSRILESGEPSCCSCI